MTRFLCSFRALAAGMLAAGLWAGVARAVEPSFALGPGVDSSAPVDFKAQTLETAADGRTLVGRGNVYIRQGRQIMTADHVQYNPDSGEVLARGHVVFVRSDGSVWKGEELSYNFKSGQGDFGAFVYYSDPVYVYAEKSEMPAPNVIELQNVTITTCEAGDHEYEVRLGEATLTDQRYLVARQAVVYLGPVPVMWWPYYKRDLKASSQWEFLPGYSSRLGAFLIASYKYPVNDDGTVRGRTSGHFYEKRGIGASQDFKWKATNSAWRGEFKSFYINDQKTFKNENQRAAREDFLDEQDSRYRLRLSHTQVYSARDSLIASGAYLSDPFVTEDFFRREFRQSEQPENRATYTHNGEFFTASLLVNSRLNDFYDNVNRLPEAGLSVYPVRIGDTPFYYESQNTAVNLARVYPDSSKRDDYDALRLDSGHMIYYPGRYFNFLSFTPRAGARGTYYSKTLGDAQSVTNLVTITDTNGVTVGTSNRVDTIHPEAGAELRQLLELGFETSFKAFKVLDDGDTIWGNGLRHVVEPYARHTYIPEPNLRPDNLLQFDEIDRVDMQHTVTLGLRNKYQTRRNGGYYLDRSSYRQTDPMDATFDGMEAAPLTALPAGRSQVVDLINVDVWTYYRIEKQEGEEDFGPVSMWTELRPSSWFRARLEGAYDTYASEIQQFNSQISVGGQFMVASVDHLYRFDAQNLLSLQFDFMPRAKWSFRTYHRFDAENSRLEEQSYYIRRTMDCLGWGVGFRHEPGYDDADDDLSVWLQLWLLAMPGTELQLGG